MDFIFMLTRDDQTVADALQVADEIESVPLTHIGFKDVGVDTATLQALHRKLKARNATTYLEVVSTTKQAALESARVGRDLGVDWLMGGTWVEETLQVLDGSATQYLPFPGNPVGHPTVLGGSPEVIADHTRQFVSAGAAGVDLLAYRASEADPLDLVRAARNAAPESHLVVAGSIVNREQIAALSDAGADGFTIGQAAFAGVYDPRQGSLRSQLVEILDAAATANR
ncbi:hypothetical protein ASE16_02415 [Leifsonia sp. Root227]|uniref:hypothetical protein n=1 Tax=Leifsonia sp. Root227 TaxID=1736496 RepID=UPI0006F42073|nr:hypothetical protein [Leifsonia sp. Root227]KRC51942.1 hypothetical protein ASE16_02415 [Leifsonia sp. Root227]